MSGICTLLLKLHSPGEELRGKSWRRSLPPFPLKMIILWLYEVRVKVPRAGGVSHNLEKLMSGLLVPAPLEFWKPYSSGAYGVWPIKAEWITQNLYTLKLLFSIHEGDIFSTIIGLFPRNHSFNFFSQSTALDSQEFISPPGALHKAKLLDLYRAWPTLVKDPREGLGAWPGCGQYKGNVPTLASIC